jgi:hypothetical protein
MDLDDVATVLDLAAHDSHHFVLVTHDFGITGGAVIGDQPPGGSTDGGHQCERAGAHVRALNDSCVDAVAQCGSDVEQTIDVEHRRDAGLQHLLQVVRGEHRCGCRLAMIEEFVVRRGLAEGDVHVRIDEARHHREARAVDRGEALLQRRVDREVRADGGDHVADHENVDVFRRRGARTVDDVAALEESRGRL